MSTVQSSGPQEHSPELLSPVMADVPQINEVPEVFQDNKVSWTKRVLVAGATGVALAGGAALAGDGSPIEGAQNIVHAVQEGYSPNPEVSPSGTQALIKANEALLDYGQPVALSLLAGYGLLYGTRRWNGLEPNFVDLGYDKRSGESSRITRVLGTVVIAFGASASSLSGQAAENANEPARIVMEGLGVSGDTPIIVPHRNYIPFNHGNLGKPEAATIKDGLSQEGASLVPVKFELGNVEDPSKKVNPSTAPITALPTEAFEQAFHVDIKNPNEKGYQGMQVVVGEQLGTDPGDTVLVEGRPATVVGEVDIYAGLDRVAVFGSVEQMGKSIFKDEPYSAAVVPNFKGGPDELQATLSKMGIEYHAEDLDELLDKYKDFWQRSVSPQTMQMEALLAGASAVAVFGNKLSSVNGRRRRIAADMSHQIEEESLIKTELLRSGKDIKDSALVAIPLAIAVAYITNSSQYGLEQAASSKSLGAGILLYSVVNGVATYAGAARKIKKIDPQAEMRSTL